MKEYNEELFANHLKRLKEIIPHICDPKESVHRIQNLEKALEIDDIDRFLQLAHEIESVVFLRELGGVKLSNDAKGKSGVDILFQGDIYIECVCCTRGKKGGPEETRLDSLGRSISLWNSCKLGPVNNRLWQDILNARITTTLQEKYTFYQAHVEDGSIPPDCPYVILLAYGRLLMDVPTEIDRLKEVLYGYANPQVLVNPITNEYIEAGYAQRDTFKKWNKAYIDCNIFQNEDCKGISGILLATQQQGYTVDNVVLYLNPFAENKLCCEAIPVKHTP